MQPHYSQSRPENATPSSGTSPLAYYQEVHPPGEICCRDTFKLLLKSLLKELFANKGGILSCKSVKPCKNRKNTQAYYARTRDKSGSNSPPFQGNVQIPPSPGMMHSEMPRLCQEGGGGMLKLPFDWYTTYFISHTQPPPQAGKSNLLEKILRIVKTLMCFELLSL